MIILGIDPGIGRTGWGVIETKPHEAALAFGCIETSKTLLEGIRLKQLADELRVIIKKYKPAHITVEKLYFTSNQLTAMTVAHARGVVLLVAAEHNLPVTEVTPTHVKSVLAGTTNVTKAQMQTLVQKQLHLQEKPRPDDAADALAVALCGAAQLRWERMTNATA